MTQDPGLSPHQQPPLTLIQMRENHPELRRQHLSRSICHAQPHTTALGANQGTYGLFLDGP